MTTPVVNFSTEKRLQAKLEKQLTEIRDRPENQKCMDCTEKYPKMFNMTHNTVVCGNCAIIHREMGHRIKALTQSNFDQAEVERLNKGGNQVARDTYLVGWKNTIYREPYPTDTFRVRDFIRMKYSEKRWYKPYTGPIERPKDEEEEEEEEVDTRKRSVSEPPAPPASIMPTSAIPTLEANPNDPSRMRSQSFSQHILSSTHSLPPQNYSSPISPAQVLPAQSLNPISPNAQYPISPTQVLPTQSYPISPISPTQSLPQQSQQYTQPTISPTHLTTHQQILNPDQWKQVQAQQQQQLQELQIRQQNEQRQYQEAQIKQQELLKQQHAQQQAEMQQKIQQQQQQLQQHQQQYIQQQQQQLQFQQQQQASQYQQQQQSIQQQQQQLQQKQQQLQQQMAQQQQSIQQQQQQLAMLQQQQQPTTMSQPAYQQPIQQQQPMQQQPLYQQQQPMQQQQTMQQQQYQQYQQQQYQQQQLQQQQQQQRPLAPTQSAGPQVSYYNKQYALPEQVSQENDYAKALVVHQQVPETSQTGQSTKMANYAPYPITPDNKALVVHQHSNVTALKQNPFIPAPAMPVVVSQTAPSSNDVFNMMECGNVLDFDEDQTAAWQLAEQRKQQFLKDEEIARKMQEQEGGLPRSQSGNTRPSLSGNNRHPVPGANTNTRRSQQVEVPQEPVYPGINSCGSCQMSIKEQDMGRHRVSECVFRPVACPYCKKSVKFVQHKDHVDICGSKQHVCYVCGLGMTGVYIPDHQFSAHGISQNSQNSSLIY